MLGGKSCTYYALSFFTHVLFSSAFEVFCPSTHLLFGSSRRTSIATTTTYRKGSSALLSFPSPSDHEDLTRDERYAQAARIRRLHGHDAAQPLYRSLLQDYGRDGDADASAATRLAALSDSNDLNQACAIPENMEKLQEKLKLQLQLRDALKTANFTNSAVQSMFGIHGPDHAQFFASSPIYLKTIKAGTSVQKSPSVQTATQCLVCLFLLGWSLPIMEVETILGKPLVELLSELHLLRQCEIDNNNVFGLVSLLPLDSCDRSFWLATDWHPNVLGTTRLFSDSREPVMYIGPDSLALVQHGLESLVRSCPATETSERDVSASFSRGTVQFVHVDVCTGSGIQALVAADILLQRFAGNESATPELHILAMDVNPRALEWTLYNFCCNGLMNTKQSIVLHLIQADIYRPESACHMRSIASLSSDDKSTAFKELHFANLTNLLESISDNFTANSITANPPFVPAPRRSTMEREGSYGLFSTYRPSVTEPMLNATSGSSTGEEVWKAILTNLVQPYLYKDGGRVGIVSEFFWAMDPTEAIQQVAKRIPGLLLTNEFPLNMKVYAERRAFGSDEHDVDEWFDFLQNTLGYRFMSPGLLFLDKVDEGVATEAFVFHEMVPKSMYGSLWTPSNPHAVDYTRRSLESNLNWKR